MADWRDVMNARTEADTHAGYAEDARRSDADAVVAALLAVQLEIRALGALIDFCGDPKP